MKGIFDIRIGTQLKVGFGVIFVFLMLISFTSLRQTQRIASTTATMYDHPLQVSQAIGSLRSDVLSMHRAMKDLVLAAEANTILPALDGYRVDALKQLDILQERYLGPESDLDGIREDFEKWNTIRGETIRLLREGQVEEAHSRTMPSGPGGRYVDILLERIDTVESFAHKKAAELFADSVTLRKTLGFHLVLLVSILSIITLAIIFFVIRNIQRPLSELTTATQRFRKGEMGERVAYSSDNEFGVLFRSFNEMAETVGTMFKLNERAAALTGIMLSEDDAHRFCHVLLSSLLEHTEAQIGAMYLLGDDKVSFEHFESVGSGAGGRKAFSAKHFEGEFGLALSSGKLQHIKDIPGDSRFSFDTVNGTFAPREMITMPIVSGTETVAMISLATIKAFSDNTLRLLETILVTLGARVDGILSYRKIIEISRRLEQQNSELEARKDQLSVQASELTEQNAELEMQKSQLALSNQLKTSFLSNMSHELRTPLNSVIALAGVLGRRLAGKVPEEEHGYLDVIERNGRQLLELINDILDLARIESGREECELQEFDLGALVREVVEMIEPQARLKGLRMEYVADGEAQPIVSSDMGKYRHIIQNIIANAVKFTDTGSVIVRVELIGDAVSVSVHDTGIGIKAESLPYIFDEFRQVDDGNSRKHGGTGLGLAIARKYADLLGADIKVESGYGKGSTFTVLLPRRTSAGEAGPAGSRAWVLNPGNQTRVAVTAAGHHDAAGKNILLVEDSEAIIIQLKDMLEAQGYGVVIARNGREALERIGEGIPDAMILDLMMPEIDGFEVLRRIRGEHRTERLPVLILTAKYVSKEELSVLRLNHVHQLMQKGGINKVQLLGMVELMLSPQAEASISVQARDRRRTVAGTPVILVVEDNADNMLTVKALLDDKYVVLEAGDGITAVELARSRKPDLILMDIALPGVSGTDIMVELRSISETSGIPIIAVSASAMSGDRERLLASGFDAYIPKPIESGILGSTIKSFLI